MAATEQIKNFICAAETYRKNESSKSLAQLQRHVKVSCLGIYLPSSHQNILLNELNQVSMEDNCAL